MAKAILRGAKISPLKVRLLAKSIKQFHKSPSQLLTVLKQMPNKSAKLLLATLSSAIANAENNHNCDVDDLVIDSIAIDEGPVLKRMMPRAKGRGDRIIKRTSHITVVVREERS